MTELKTSHSELESCLVVIPARNEETDIASVIADIRKAHDYPIVVVDDQSSDQTRARAHAAGAMVIPLAVQLGAWGATQTGIRYAANHGFDFVITMDADGQHSAGSLNALTMPILNGAADITLGSCPQRGSILRHVAWFILRHVSALKYVDITSGLRVYNRPAIELLSRRAATMIEYQDVGVLALLQSLNQQIVEVPVTMAPRKSGKSRVFNSWFKVAYYMAYTLLLGVTKRRVRHTGYLQIDQFH